MRNDMHPKLNLTFANLEKVIYAFIIPYLQSAVARQGDPTYTCPSFTSLVTCLLEIDFSI